jgi:hypothetical protein
MKKLFTLLFLVFISLKAFTQNPADSGFTNKAEATNSTINGLKQGKWLEYPGKTDDDVSSDSNAPYYILNYYKDGKRIGISRRYSKNDGTLFTKEYYKNGKMDGPAFQYYPSGKVEVEAHLTNGKLNGLMKRYYEDGNLEAQANYVNGQKTDEKNFSGGTEPIKAQTAQEKQAEQQALLQRARRDSIAVAARMDAYYKINHTGRNDIFDFTDENGTCQQAQLIILPAQNQGEINAQWQTRLPSDVSWKSPDRWLHFMGTDGKQYEIRTEATVNQNSSGQDDMYNFKFVAVPMSGEGKEKQNAKLGFRDCNGTVWWCQKVHIDKNNKIYFDLGSTRPE